MKYNINSIPTRYEGVLFRSRLEAKWAAFFDLLDWQWQYEPIDFSGWIPDFALYGEQDVVYVEVKPVTVFPGEVAAKIESSRCTDEVLIVGQRPFPAKSWGCTSCVGWLAEVWPPEDAGVSERKFLWGEAAFGKWRDGKGKIGFCHTEQLFRDRISGGYDGGCFGALDDGTGDEVRALWSQACNETAWSPK